MAMAQDVPMSFIEVNNVRGTIYGIGASFHSRLDNPDLSWEVPKGSGLSPLFQQSLWIGGTAQSDNSLHLAGLQFGQGSGGGFDFWSGPLRLDDATIDLATMEKYCHVWNLTKTEIDNFIAHHGDEGYVAPNDILTWPAHGDEGYAEYLAPFVDANGDGRYNPEDGDYPAIIGDQCLFYIFNDNYGPHSEFQGEALGIELHGMAYAFNAPDNEVLNNTVFFRYKIYNRSSENYNNMYINIFNDWDIGDGWDDYVGCDVQHGTCYAYNAFVYDEDYGENPPVQLCALIAGPYMDPDGLDNPAYSGDCESVSYYSGTSYGNGANFGNGIIDDERLGMTGFGSFSNASSQTGDPHGAEEAYFVMRGYWRDGQRMQFGGMGYPGVSGTVGPECKYIYPGDSDPCNYGTFGMAPNGGYNIDGKFWTEEQVMNAPNDRRGVSITGPFTLEAGGMQPLDFALTTVWNDGDQSALSRIGMVVEQLHEEFNNFQTAVGEHPLKPESTFKAYPNPTQGTFVVEGTGRLAVMNLLGQVVMVCEISGQTQLTLPSGMYFLTLENGQAVSTQKIVVE